MQNMKNIGLSDTKPINYNYLTFRLISSETRQDKVELIKNLERLLLKSLISGQSQEGWIPLGLVKVFQGGGFRRAITVWYNLMMPHQKYARKLIKTCRFRWN